MKTKPPIIIGHRGNARFAPENTRVSYLQAIEIGVPMVEMDTHLTRDGQIVLMHDDTIDRTTNGSGNVGDFTHDALRKLDAGSWKDPKFKGERIPTLTEIARSCRDKAVMMLDLKSPGQGPALARWIAEQQYPSDQLILGAWDEAEGIALRSALPESSLVRITEELPDFGQLTKIGFRGVSLEWKLVTADLVKSAKAHGMLVYAWTLNEPAEIRAAVEARVDGIITDDPRAALALL